MVISKYKSLIGESDRDMIRGFRSSGSVKSAYISIDTERNIRETWGLDLYFLTLFFCLDLQSLLKRVKVDFAGHAPVGCRQRGSN